MPLSGQWGDQAEGEGDVMTVPRTVRGRSVLLLNQLRELLAAVDSGAVPGVGPAYRHRVQGGITALEAALGLAPSLVPELRERLRTGCP